METAPAYEGRGGKIRRTPHRRAAAATPYDRPSSAARPPRAPAEENVRDGWISKFTGPATRLIAGGASRLFGSVFGQRPVAAPAVESGISGGNDQSIQEDEEVAINKPSHVLQEGKIIDESCPTVDTNASNISEFEHLVKEKTLTRMEFEHLIEVLRSRTIGLDSPSANVGKQDELHILPSANVLEGPVSTGVSQPYDPTRLKNDNVSPEELAKAYMSSRSKVSPSLGIQGQVSHEQKSQHIFTPEPVASSILSKSVVRFSGSSENPESGYLTPNYRGKSAMYKFSRSPYSKFYDSTDVKDDKLFRGEYTGSTSFFQTPKSTMPSSVRQDDKLFRGEYTGSTSYFQTPKSTMQSSERQVLKRRSSVLDSEAASIGPVRRIRQKHILSPAKVTIGSPRRSPSSEVIRDVTDNSASQMHNQLQGLHDKTQQQTVEKGKNLVYDNSAASVPPKSVETAKKIFQHLDKLGSSPKEKLSKLSDSLYSNSKSVSGNNLAVGGPSPMIGTKKILHEKQVTIQENTSSFAALGTKLTSESSHKHTGVFPSINVLPRSSSDATCSDSIVAQQKKPAFQITQRKESLTTKKDNNILKVSFNSMDASKKEAEIETAQEKAGHAESTSSHSHTSGSESLKLTDTNDSDNGAGFKFPAAPAPNTYLQAPQIHGTPSLVDDSSLMKEEQTTSPSFSFGAKSTASLVFSAPTVVTSLNIPDAAENGAMQKEQSAVPLFTFGATNSHKIVFLSPTTNSGIGITSSSDNSQSQPQILSSFGGVEFDKGRQVQKPHTIFSASMKATQSPVFAFGTSNDEIKNNGSLGPSSTGFTGIFPPTQNSVSQSSSLSSSSVTPVSSKGPLFQFGPNKDLGEKAVKESLFNVDGSTPTISIFSKIGNNTLSGPAKASEFSKFSSTPTTAATISSTENNSTALGTSSFFSTTGGSQSAQSASAITVAGNSNFTFGFSGQPSNANSLGSDNGLKELPSTATATSGSLFGSSSIQSAQKIPPFDNALASQVSSPPPLVSPSSASLFSSTNFSTSISQFGSSSNQVSNNPFKSSIANSSFGSGASPIQTSFSMSSTSAASPFTFGLSTASQFSSTSSSVSGFPSPLQPVFGAATTGTGQISASTVTEETNQKLNGGITKLDQSGTIPLMSSHAITTSGSGPGSGAIPFFQFGTQQNSPAQATGNSEFTAGGSFSMGSGGIDKANRRVFKAKRKK